MKVNVNIISMRCINTCEAVTMTSLMMVTSILSEKSLAGDTHTNTDRQTDIYTYIQTDRQTDRQLFASIVLIFFKIVSDYKNNKMY